jgi:hypothetical protein
MLIVLSFGVVAVVVAQGGETPRRHGDLLMSGQADHNGVAYHEAIDHSLQRKVDPNNSLIY